MKLAEVQLNLNDFLTAVAAQLPAVTLLGPEAAARAYGACTTGRSRAIAAALRLEQREQVVQVVKLAAAHDVALYPISTGRNWGYGSSVPARPDCVVLDLSGMRRIIDFDPKLGVITLEPGVTQGQLAAFLDTHHHPYLVPVTGAGPDCSLLGNALERGFGITPYADHFFAVQALRAVLADGSEYRSALSELGGERIDRLFKWGVGPYVDGLFTQAGLGVVTEMSIALARRPEATVAGLFGLPEADRLAKLVALVGEVLADYPGVVGGINLMNQHRVLAMAAPYPGASGHCLDAETLAALAHSHRVKAWTGLVTLYGTHAVVAAARRGIAARLRPLVGRVSFVRPHQARRLESLAKGLGGLIPAGIKRKLTMLSGALELVSGRPNRTALPLAYWRSGQPMPQVLPADPARDGCGLLWYAPLVPIDPEVVTQFVAMIRTVCPRHGMEPLITLTSLSPRVFDSTVPLLFNLSQSAEVEAAHACLAELQQSGQQLGCLPYRVGTHAMPWLTGGNSRYWALVGQIKAALDPQGIIAPGRYSR